MESAGMPRRRSPISARPLPHPQREAGYRVQRIRDSLRSAAWHCLAIDAAAIGNRRLPRWPNPHLKTRWEGGPRYMKLISVRLRKAGWIPQDGVPAANGFDGEAACRAGRAFMGFL